MRGRDLLKNWGAGDLGYVIFLCAWVFCLYVGLGTTSMQCSRRLDEALVLLETGVMEEVVEGPQSRSLRVGKTGPSVVVYTGELHSLAL